MAASNPKPVINIADLVLNRWSRGEKYASADLSFGRALGMTEMGISYCEVPPGKSGRPFHNHQTEHEMFVILEGSGEYRYGDKVYPIRAGDALAAPASGREGAHQILNTGSGPLRYIGVSNKAETDIVEYPDSDKFLAIRLNSDKTGKSFEYLGKARAILNFDDEYYAGEPGA